MLIHARPRLLSRLPRLPRPHHLFDGISGDLLTQLPLHHRIDSLTSEQLPTALNLDLYVNLVNFSLLSQIKKVSDVPGL